MGFFGLATEVLYVFTSVEGSFLFRTIGEWRLARPTASGASIGRGRLLSVSLLAVAAPVVDVAAIVAATGRLASSAEVAVGFATD